MNKKQGAALSLMLLALFSLLAHESSFPEWMIWITFIEMALGAIVIIKYGREK